MARRKPVPAAEHTYNILLQPEGGYAVTCPSLLHVKLNWKTIVTERAMPKVFIDNERVRVTEWRFAPGAATGWHRHALDYVVVPMADGELELVGADGERTRAQLRHGVPYFRTAGVEHDVINANRFEFAFVEIERK